MTFDEDDELNWTPVPPLPTLAALGMLIALGTATFRLIYWLL